MIRIAAALLILSAGLRGQSPAPAQIEPVFAAYRHADTPGCAAAVESGSNNSWTGAYGMADLEHNVANTPTTVFEAGSVSKQFTAAAVLLLVERGQVSLDDDIRRYFPEMPAYARPITVRQLLNHTSGLRDWGSVEAIAGWPRTTREYSHAHVLEILSRQHSLNYTPGDAWSYTNSGYNLAAMLVERITGTTLQAFERREYFEPLGMESTQWRDDFRRIVHNRAIAYQQRNSEWRQDMPFEDIYGNGGLLTTVGDLLKWNRNITSGKLHRGVFELMQRPGVLNNGRQIGYGFGLFLEDFQGLAEVSHSGSTAGYRAWLGRIPSKDFSVAVLCNAASANATEYAHQIARLYLGLANPPRPSAPPEFNPGLYRSVRDRTTIRVERNGMLVMFNGRPADIDVRFLGEKMMTPNATYGEDVWERVTESSPSGLSAFAGDYTSDEAETVLSVVAENGSLAIHRRPNVSMALKPAGADEFDSPMGNIHFVRDANGKVTALSVGESRVWELRFTRLQ